MDATKDDHVPVLYPATAALLEWFDYRHLQSGPARAVSAKCCDLANQLAVQLGDTPHGAELTAGMRKLLEAKDCFVRAAL